MAGVNHTFVSDITIVLGASALGGFIVHRLRQPVLLGYLIAGLLIGPFGFGQINQLEEIKSLADIGVAFLLFALGVEFSLAELVIVVAIVITLIFITIPIYTHCRTRTKIRTRSRISLELEKLELIASEYISNNLGVINYSLEDLENIVPDGFSIKDSGTLVLNTNHIVENSKILLVPTLTSGAMTWNCIGIGLTDLQIPSSCENKYSPSETLVNSLYDPTIDVDLFTFSQFGRLTINCINYKCTVAAIDGQRWMAQYIDSLDIIQLYKENSEYSISLYGDDLAIDASIINSALLQQFVDESIILFNK